ncbi:Uncharacterised protein [Clostridium perfringens]|uniref:Uncharacterized protein n=1 Tax=Clostridium perfringens TaxID=1502 RepID=A0A2X2Y7Y3_CLOPF|nr:Uncharacterised protein [Clostridium perfringens]
MSKKLKELMRVIKEHKKTSIGVAVALAIAITGGVSYSILSNTYNKTNNTALSEKLMILKKLIKIILKQMNQLKQMKLKLLMMKLLMKVKLINQHLKMGLKLNKQKMEM